MRKGLAWLAALLLMLTPALGEETIPEAQVRVLEACQLALEYLQDACGLTVDETALLTPVAALQGEEEVLTAETIDYDQVWWQITFSLPGLAEDGVIAIAVEGESRYTYLDFGNPDGFFEAFQAWQQWQQQYDAAQLALIDWQLRLGDPLFWTYEEKAAFYQEFGLAPDAAGEDAGLACAMPRAGDLSLEAALQAAAAALEKHLGAGAEELAGLKTGAAFTEDFWHPWGERAWIIHFYGPEASIIAPDRRYTVFILSPDGEAVNAMRITEGAGDGDYWSVLDE